MNLLLKNISWIDGDNAVTADVRIGNGFILEIGNLISLKKEKTIDLQNHFLYPGLINAHDHLEMNLYPRLGNPLYNNYVEWANDIYKPKESPVKEIESVDIKDRLLWGGVKNLISGVTTVVHHNPWHSILSKDRFPVGVVETSWAHSLAFEKNIVKKFPKNLTTPFVVHLAEGIDAFASDEILKLNALGLLKENTALIHAVATNDENLKLLERANASMIWCPSSNLFMFGKTAPVEKLKKKIRVALGTDSTMTGLPTLLDEMRVARTTGLATTKEIFDMVTNIPKKIFNLQSHQINSEFVADLLIAPIKTNDYYENLFQLNAADVTAVFVRGQLQYGDIVFAKEIEKRGFNNVVGNIDKWFSMDVSNLKKNILKKTKAIAGNSLWHLLS